MNSLENKMTWPEIVDYTYDRVKDWIKDEKDFKEWLMTKEQVGYLFDHVMISKCYTIYKKLKKFDDYVIVIVGREGSGKTTLSAQISAYIDSNFDVPRMSFTSLEFIQNLRKGQPGDAVTSDEGGLMLFSRESMSLQNRSNVKTLMVVRKKSLALCICVPDYNSIDSYIRNHRTKLLIEVISRGHYKAIFGEGLKKINREIGKMKNINAITLPEGYFWHGHFRKCFPKTMDEEAYQKKKDEHIDLFLSEVENEQKKLRDVDLTKQRLLTAQQFADQTSMDIQKLRKCIKNGIIKGVKVVNEWFVPYSELERLTNPEKTIKINQNKDEMEP
jgi:hypothetical protein